MSAPGTAQRLLSSSTFTVLALLVNISASLILVPFLIDRLGDGWYGTWILIGTMLGYFVVLDFGLFSAAERYIAVHFARREWDEVNIILSTCMVLFCGAGLVALALGLAAAAAVPWVAGDPESARIIRAALVIAAVDVALLFPGGLVNGILVAQVRFDLAALMGIVKVAVRTVLILVVIDAGHSIVALAAITLATNTAERLAKAYAAWRLYPHLRLSRRLIRTDRIGAYARFGVYSFIAEVSEKVRFSVDVVVVGLILGAALVTVYNIATRLVSYYMQLIVSGVGFMLPVFAALAGRGDEAGLRRDFLFVSKLAVLASVLFGGGLIFVARPFVELWIGPDYGAAFVPLAIITAAVMLELAQMPSGHLLMALNRHGFLARLGCGEALANLLLSLALAGPLGLAGVALGTAIPLVVARVGLLPVHVCRQIGLAPMHYAREIGGLGLAAVLVQAPLWLVRPALLEMPLAAAAAVTALAYAMLAAGLVRFGLGRGDRERLRGHLLAWLHVTRREDARR